MTTGSTIVLLVSLVAYPGIAFAYIDPGTGSILIQGIIAAVAAIGVTLKLYWHRLVVLFRRSKSPPETAPTGGDDETES